MRLAADKYIKRGDCKTVADALERLLGDGLLQTLNSGEDPVKWREGRFGQEIIHDYLKEDEVSIFL